VDNLEKSLQSESSDKGGQLKNMQEKNKKLADELAKEKVYDKKHTHTQYI
jgi:hypothetical protein